MNYRQVLINSAESVEEPKPLNYMAERNRKWYAEWLQRRASYRAQQKQKEEPRDGVQDEPTV